MKCPICSTPKMNVKSVKKIGKLPSGDEFSYSGKLYSCKECQFESFLGSDEKSFRSQERAATKLAIKQIVGKLHDRFSNLLFVERSLSLPRRTLSRWKRLGEGSSSSLLLLKLIEVYPFLLNVVDSRFNKDVIVAELKGAVASLPAQASVEQLFARPLPCEKTQASVPDATESDETMTLTLLSGGAGIHAG